MSLASVLDRVANDHEIVIIRRKGDKRVAMVPADELAGLIETPTCYGLRKTPAAS
jgi:PHD/YefM family antitoxin component YafN of YafNO toxin-antitoxin module